MVVFDANFLLLLLDPEALPPKDPTTNRPVEKVKERIEALIESLDKAKTKIVIPTPALSEVLIGAGDAAPEYLEILNLTARFKVAAFDLRAAVEAAAAHREAKEKGDKREGTGATWAKVKFDRQIISIAKVEGAKTIYSDDADIKKLAENSELKAIGLIELPLPEEDRQQSLKLLPPDQQEKEAVLDNERADTEELNEKDNEEKEIGDSSEDGDEINDSNDDLEEDENST